MHRRHRNSLLLTGWHFDSWKVMSVGLQVYSLRFKASLHVCWKFTVTIYIYCSTVSIYCMNPYSKFQTLNILQYLTGLFDVLIECWVHPRRGSTRLNVEWREKFKPTPTTQNPPTAEQQSAADLCGRGMSAVCHDYFFSNFIWNFEKRRGPRVQEKWRRCLRFESLLRLRSHCSSVASSCVAVIQEVNIHWLLIRVCQHLDFPWSC